MSWALHDTTMFPNVQARRAYDEFKQEQAEQLRESLERLRTEEYEAEICQPSKTPYIVCAAVFAIIWAVITFFAIITGRIYWMWPICAITGVGILSTLSSAME